MESPWNGGGSATIKAYRLISLVVSLGTQQQRTEGSLVCDMPKNCATSASCRICNALARQRSNPTTEGPGLVRQCCSKLSFNVIPMGILALGRSTNRTT